MNEMKDNIYKSRKYHWKTFVIGIPSLMMVLLGIIVVSIYIFTIMGDVFNLLGDLVFTTFLFIIILSSAKAINHLNMIFPYRIEINNNRLIIYRPIMNLVLNYNEITRYRYNVENELEIYYKHVNSDKEKCYNCFFISEEIQELIKIRFLKGIRTKKEIWRKKDDI